MLLACFFVLCVDVDVDVADADVICVCFWLGRDSPLAHFRWHRKPITAVEWRPDDESEIVVASADNTVRVVDSGCCNTAGCRVMSRCSLSGHTLGHVG